MIVELYAEFLHAHYDYFPLLAIFQPALAPAIATYLLIKLWRRISLLLAVVIVALSLYFLGDYILVSYRDQFNMPSVISYLIGHITWAIAFLVSTKDKNSSTGIFSKIVMITPPIIIALFYFVYLYPFFENKPNYSNQYIPFVIYACSFLFMIIAAIWRIGHTSNLSFLLIVIGASLYLISDITTSYNFFIKAIPEKYLITMGLYGTSLLCFCIGIITHVDDKNKLIYEPL